MSNDEWSNLGQIQPRRDFQAAAWKIVLQEAPLTFHHKGLMTPIWH